MNRREHNYGQDEYVDDAHSFRNDDGRPFRGNDEEDRWTGQDDRIRQRNTRRSNMGRDFDQDMAEKSRERFQQPRESSIYGDEYRYRFDEDNRDRSSEMAQQMREQQVKREYLEQQKRNDQRPRDERLEEEVCNALLRDRNIDAQQIEVRVDSGIVTLSGMVGSRSARFDAEMAADSVRGVVDIENNIKVRKWTDQRSNQQTDQHYNREERELGERGRSDSRRY